MKELVTALIAARKDMPDPRKSGTNPAFRSKFVPRDEALDSVVPSLLKHGLMFVQYPVATELGIGVHTQLLHDSGQSLDLGVFTVTPSKNDPQGAVAATTYASRCAIMLAFSIAGDDDDDGNSVSQAPAKAAAKAPAKAPAKPRAAAKPLYDAIAAAIERGAEEAAVKKEVVRQWGMPDELTIEQIAEAVKFVQSLGGDAAE